MMQVTRSVALACMVLMAGGAALADESFMGQPEVLHIEGTITADQDAAGKIGFDAVSLGFDNSATTRWLGIVAARTRMGGPDRGREIISNLDPFTPMLLISGPKATVGKLRNAAVGTRVAVEGMVE